MSRLQLALNVKDIDEAVTFYSKLFGTEPAKRRPGYANFAISEPPLKLVLLENPGQGGTSCSVTSGPGTSTRNPSARRPPPLENVTTASNCARYSVAPMGP
jgi:catechol 2,3-dioxygenase-like lactoylglutathione lyase family enzyme